MNAPLEVLVLGAGFAGLETAFLLQRRVHERARVTIVSDVPKFTCRPNTIDLPFAIDAGGYEIDVRHGLRERRIDFVGGRACGFDPIARTVDLTDGTALMYDALVIATGAAANPSEIPGLAEHAAAITAPAGMLALRDQLEHVVRRARDGRAGRVVLLDAPGAACPAPMWELAQKADAYLRAHGVREQVEVVWATPDARWLEGLGPAHDDVVALDLEARGIIGHRGWIVERVTSDEVRFVGGAALGYDALACFPPRIGAVRWLGLPTDGRAFLHCEPTTRRVVGHPHVYAPGDAGDHPLKQASCALLQADAVAEHIAAGITGREPAAQFDAAAVADTWGWRARIRHDAPEHFHAGRPLRSAHA